MGRCRAAPYRINLNCKKYASIESDVVLHSFLSTFPGKELPLTVRQPPNLRRAVPRAKPRIPFTNKAVNPSVRFLVKVAAFNKVCPCMSMYAHVCSCNKVFPYYIFNGNVLLRLGQFFSALRRAILCADF